MVSKKILGVAIAAAFSSQAFALIDATTDPQTTVKVAKESVLTTQMSDGTAPAGVAAGMVVLTNTVADNVNIKFKAGSGVATGGHAYIRVNLTNAVFAAAAPALSTSGVAFVTQSVMQGGAAGNSSAIFDVTSPAGAGIVQTDTLTLPLTTLAVSASAPVTVDIAMYDTPSAAVNETIANRLSHYNVPSAVSVGSFDYYYYC